MNKKQTHTLFFAMMMTGLIMMTACSPSLKIKLDESNPNSIEESDFSLTFSPTALNFASAFSSQGSIFDAGKISAAFSELDFPNPVSVETPTAGNIQLIIKFGNIDTESSKVFSVEGGNLKTFSLDKEKKILRINFNKEIVTGIISLLPEELFEYSDLMMAPILTGENISEEEYTELISSAYGASAGQELQNSFFKIDIECPGQVINADTTEQDIRTDINGRTAAFTIPVSKMLSLYNPIGMEVSWK